jgi:hypothetical protein
MTAWARLDAERGTERAVPTAESLSKLAAIATIADCIDYTTNGTMPATSSTVYANRFK